MLTICGGFKNDQSSLLKEESMLHKFNITPYAIILCLFGLTLITVYPVIANVDAQPKRDSKSAIQALVDQVSAPVQWEAVIRRLVAEGVTTYVEVGPGTVLSGLIRKIHPKARTLHFGALVDLPNISNVLAS